MVLYILLSGQPPFYDDDNFELFEKIKQCKYDLTSGAWKFVSAEAKDFISKLLVADPSKRLKAAEIQNHPWIKKTKSEGSGVNILVQMREWNTKRKLEALKKNVGGEDEGEKGFD